MVGIASVLSKSKFLFTKIQWLSTLICSCKDLMISCCFQMSNIYQYLTCFFHHCSPCPGKTRKNGVHWGRHVSPYAMAAARRVPEQHDHGAHSELPGAVSNSKTRDAKRRFITNVFQEPMVWKRKWRDWPRLTPIFGNIYCTSFWVGKKKVFPNVFHAEAFCAFDAPLETWKHFAKQSLLAACGRFFFLIRTYKSD